MIQILRKEQQHLKKTIQINREVFQPFIDAVLRRSERDKMGSAPMASLQISYYIVYYSICCYITLHCIIL